MAWRILRSGDLGVVRGAGADALTGLLDVVRAQRCLQLVGVGRAQRVGDRGGRVGVAREQDLVGLLLVLVELEDPLVGVLVTSRVGSRVPLVVLLQRQRLVDAELLDLVRAARERLAAVRRERGVLQRDRADRHEGRPEVVVRERLAGADRDLLAVSLHRVAVAALVGAGVVLGAVDPADRVGLAGTRGERLGVERAQDAVLDLFAGDRVTGLPLGVVLDRELPLGEVLVGRAEVGGEVGDQLHVTGFGVAAVLRQRPVGEGLLDRVAEHRPSVGGVEVLGTRVRRDEHGDGATGGGALDLGRGALGVGDLLEPGVRIR